MLATHLVWAGDSSSPTPVPAPAPVPVPLPTPTTTPPPILPGTSIPVSRGSLNPAKHGLGRLPSNPKVMVIPINDESTTREGMIDEWQANFVDRRLKRAKAEKFDLVILEIDTYGGEVRACDKINKTIAASGLPVVAYVKGKAFSGGAIISLGCIAIVMAPDSRIGGALAVIPGYTIDKDMRKKFDSDMRAMVRNLCDANHYSLPIAQGMVDSGTEVLETNDPSQRFMIGEDYDLLKIKPDIIKKWKNKDQILTLSAHEAVDTGLAAGMAGDRDDLLLGMNATPPYPPEVVDITGTEMVARALSHPLWRVLFVIVGLVALFWELKSPGHGVGYLTFAFCLGVFFWLQIFASNAGALEMILFGLGAGCIALEIFVFPTVGLLAFGGFGLLMLSIIMSFLPEGVSMSSVWNGTATPWEVQVVKAGLMWSAITLISIIVIVAVGLFKGAKLPGLNRMALNAQMSATINAKGGVVALPGTTAGAKPSLEALIGQSGTVEAVLRPAGKVRLNGVTYDAVSEGGYLQAGANVKVLRVSSNGLIVREQNA